jgi:hypothetical protein
MRLHGHAHDALHQLLIRQLLLHLLQDLLILFKFLSEEHLGDAEGLSNGGSGQRRQLTKAKHDAVVSTDHCFKGIKNLTETVLHEHPELLKRADKFL